MDQWVSLTATKAKAFFSFKMTVGGVWVWVWESLNQQSQLTRDSEKKNRLNEVDRFFLKSL